MIESSIEDVIYVHDQIIQTTGGLGGVQDRGLLESCMARPQQSAFGKEIYKDLFEKAAALLDAIANNHPFVDGNKRTAMASAVLFLHLASVDIHFSNQEYEDFMLFVVQKRPDIPRIKEWIVAHCKPTV